MLPALIGGVASLTGAALNYFGAREANRKGLEMAREQMDFQERMSNTAYQRTVQDMKAAGINPMLAFSQGGASTSSGSSYAPANELAGAVSSALQVKSINAQVEQTKVLTEIAKATLVEKKLEASLYSSDFGKIIKGISMLAGTASDLTGIMKLLAK